MCNTIYTLKNQNSIQLLYFILLENKLTQYKMFLSFYFNLFKKWNSREFPYTSSPFPTGAPIINNLHEDGTFITTN